MDQIEKTVDILVRKGNLTAFEDILRKKVADIYSKNCRILLGPEIKYSNFRSYQDPKAPREISLEITNERPSITKIWSLYHEAGHLNQPYPEQLTEEQKYLREQDAWRLAEEEIRQTEGLREHLLDFKKYAQWALDSYAPIDVFVPTALSPEFLEKLKNFIVSGGQVPEYWVIARLKTATRIAVKHFDGRILATAVLKNPSEGYREGVFRKAKVKGFYTIELGYIVTHPEHYKRRFAQKILEALMHHVESDNIFSTTRVEHMGRLLQKFGFLKVGETYEGDLNLYVRDAYV